MKDKLANLVKKAIIKLSKLYVKLADWDKKTMALYVSNTKKVADCTPSFKEIIPYKMYWNGVYADLENALSVARQIEKAKSDASQKKASKPKSPRKRKTASKPKKSTK